MTDMAEQLRMTTLDFAVAELVTTHVEGSSGKVDAANAEFGYWVGLQALYERQGDWWGAMEYALESLWEDKRPSPYTWFAFDGLHRIGFGRHEPGTAIADFYEAMKRARLQRLAGAVTQLCAQDGQSVE